MDCHEARQHWNLYHDSEGDPQLHFAIEEHLARCPGCAEWFKQQSRLEGMLTDKLIEGRATPALWDSVLERTGLRRKRKLGRWFLFTGVVGCAASILIALVWLSFFRGRGSQSDLDALSADWHERLSTGKGAVEFSSHSDHDVEEYLKNKVD